MLVEAITRDFSLRFKRGSIKCNMWLWGNQVSTLDLNYPISKTEEAAMRIAVGSDERTHLTDMVIEDLKNRGYELILFGPLVENDPDVDWPLTSSKVAQTVANGKADEGIVCCWTGTGASIAANKVPGIRAALCHDAETARGARIWNHANVLALSLRATPEAIAKEILDAWFTTPYSEDEWNRQQIERIKRLDAGKSSAE
jgi:ribose 5-phosphate isomerase B